MYDIYILLDDDKPVKTFTDKKDLKKYLDDESNDFSEYSNVLTIQGCVDWAMTLFRDD